MLAAAQLALDGPGLVDQDAPQPEACDATLAVAKFDEAALAGYRTQAPHAVEAQPTEDHFMPLFVALGAGGKAERLHSSATFGSLRMDAYSFA